MNNKGFQIDDLVKVQGYEDRVFKVIRITTSASFHNYKYSLQTAYRLQDVKTGETILGFPEDVYMYDKEEDKQAKLDLVDQALDKYNDEMTLYNMFGDDKYKERANYIIDSLNDFVKEELLK